MEPQKSDSGYATLLDALLFLMLVSVGAALVAHTLPGSQGLQAARELRSQRLDTAALESLLDSRPGGEGRTVGERVGEVLLAEMAGDPAPSPGLEGDIWDFLGTSLGPRYRFNLTVTWRPVPWADPAARIAVGPPAAPGATRVEQDIALPVDGKAAMPPGSSTPAAPLDRAVEALRKTPAFAGVGLGTEDPARRALAEEALSRRLQGLGPADAAAEAHRWLEENLRPNRARAVLALWTP